MGLMKELNDLNDIYQDMYVTEVSADKALEASKKADVERGKAAAAGDKDKAKAKAAQASRLYAKQAAKRKNEEVEISSEVEKLIESGKFSDAEIAKIADIQEADIADILARLEKKRISKGGNPDESPLGKKVGRAMKSQQDKARKKAGVE